MAVHEPYGNVNVWWFPIEFCQSRHGEFSQSGGNSCTLISLILANKLVREDHGFHSDAQIMAQRAYDTFSSAINDGNAVYGRAFQTVKKRSRSKNLNIPDAVNVLRSQPQVDFKLHEWFYTHLKADPESTSYRRNVTIRLSEIFSIGVELFKLPDGSTPARFLFAVLIADSRTTIFIFEIPVGVVGFYDSHQHSESGAVIAQCDISDLEDLSAWFIKMLDDVYASQPDIFEISFLTTDPNVLPQP